MSLGKASKEKSSFTSYLREMKETGSVFRWVWDELLDRDGKKRALWLSFASLAMMALFALQPLVFAQIVNGLQKQDAHWLLLAAGALASIVLVHQGVAFAQMLIREKADNWMTWFLRARLHELFNEKSLGQHTEEGSRLNYSSIESARNRIEQVQDMMLFETSTIVASLFFAYVLLWTFGWQWGVAVTLLIAVQVVWAFYLNYHVAVETAPIEEAWNSYRRQLNERWKKISRVKTNGKTRSEEQRLSRWLADIVRADQRFWFWFIRHASAQGILSHIVRLGVIGYGALLVYRGEWEIGSLIPLYAWMTTAVEDLWYIGHLDRRLNEQVPYIRALKEALTVPPAFSEYVGTKLLASEPIQVAFKNVDLFYSDGGKPYQILRDLSFTVRPGEKVALIGSSGAGKTSVMKLLLRYMDPTAGEIWINGSRLQDLELPSWMEKVGYIPQHAEVFDGTIRYNLTFGLSSERQAEITDEEIWSVMRDLQVDFGARLTEGLETRVGEDGVKLSGGQAQRLMIGAAVIKQPIFMVIDEATSSLDSSTERLVQEGLEKVLAGPVGAIIVAHRLSTVRKVCNRFIVLRPLEETPEGESQIEAEAETMETLYQISPIFRRLADDQHLAL